VISGERFERWLDVLPSWIWFNWREEVDAERALGSASNGARAFDDLVRREVSPTNEAEGARLADGADECRRGSTTGHRGLNNGMGDPHTSRKGCRHCEVMGTRC
jgi:hypothetical protein